MNSNNFIIKSLLVIISHIFTINALPTGPSGLSCRDSSKFTVGHEPSVLKKGTTVILELLQGNVNKTCIELDQEYILRISIKSDDVNEEIEGIMVGPSKGKLKKDESDEDMDQKLRQPCQNYPNIISHSQILSVKSINLIYTAPAKSRHVKTIFFNISAVFNNINEYITITNEQPNNSFSICETPPTPTPTSAAVTTTSTNSDTTSSTVSASPQPTTTTVPVFDDSMIVKCSTSLKPRENLCSKSKAFKIDVRNHTVNGIDYLCRSAATLRLFDCDSCENNCSTAHGEDCTESSRLQYTCQPTVSKGTRQYECQPYNDNSGTVVEMKFRNITIQKGCSCCPKSLLERVVTGR